MKEQYQEKSNKFYFSYSDDQGKGVDMNVQDVRNVHDIINVIIRCKKYFY